MSDFELRWLVLRKRKVLQMRRLVAVKRANPYDRKSKRINVWSPWDAVPKRTPKAKVQTVRAKRQP